MPFGMGPAGWVMLPYIYPYLGNLYQNWLGLSSFNYPFPFYRYPFGFFQSEVDYLKQIKQNLERQLEDINKRIQELEK